MGIIFVHSRPFSSGRHSAILVPAFTFHRFLYSRPNALYRLPIPPSSLGALVTVPFVQLGRNYTSAPTLNCRRSILASPANVDPESMTEELRRRLPFVRLELPRLACCEDCRKSGPVIGFELFRSVHKDESKRPLWIDGWQQAGDVKNVRVARCRIWRGVYSII